MAPGFNNGRNYGRVIFYPSTLCLPFWWKISQFNLQIHSLLPPNHFGGTPKFPAKIHLQWGQYWFPIVLVETKISKMAAHIHIEPYDHTLLVLAEAVPLEQVLVRGEQACLGIIHK